MYVPQRSPLVQLGSLAAAGLAAALLATACASSGKAPATARIPAAKAHAPRASQIDVEHYSIELALHPESRSIDGLCRVRVYPRGESIDRVELDLAGLDVSSVTDEHGRALEFRHRAGVLSIALAEPLARESFVELAIRYGGAPLKGLYFAAEERGVPTQVFTQGECEDSRFWFPCWDSPDERATSEVCVDMPVEWIAVAAGERVERTVRPAGRVFERWRMTTPHSAYLTTLVAGKFAVERELWNGVPLEYFTDAQTAPWMQACFAETERVLEFFEQLTGVRYPYAKYGQACVENFPFGGMENISATTLTANWLTDARGLRDGETYGLLAHEAAHQWFGDLLTCRDWSHIWLNEGWATYGELLYTEATRGVDTFRAAVRDTQEAYLAQDVGLERRPTVHDVYRDPMDLFTTGHAYPGAAARLHMLRFVLGDEAFFRGTRAYLAAHQGTSVTTADFQRAFEDESGEDLAWFFRQWFDGRGFPELEARWEHSDGRVSVDVGQTQGFADGTPAVFRTPVEIEIQGDGAARIERVELARRQQTFEFECAERPRWVRVDPHGWLVKRLREQRPLGEWLEIAAGCEDVNGRRDGVGAIARALKTAADQRERRFCFEALLQRLRDDESAAVRSLAAVALAGVGQALAAEASLALVDVAGRDSSAAVRVAALDTLASFGANSEHLARARELFDEGYSWGTMLAAARAVAALDPDGALSYLESKLALESPHDVLRAGVLARIALVQDPRAVDLLASWAFDEARSPEAREAAVRGLGVRGRGRAEVRRELAKLLETREYRLRSAVIDALGALRDPASLPALTAYYPRCVDSRQRRAIEGVLRADWAARQ